MESIIAYSIGPICTLLAGYIGVRYGLKQLWEQKRLDFIEKQLREFYSPLLGYRKVIRAKSELRVEISNAASEAWREKCERVRHSVDPYKHIPFEPYEEIIEYNNEQLRNELMPYYRKMLSIFTENYWLAERETLKWYSEFCKFVELWERWLAEKIPGEVIKKLDHDDETKLQPFYDDLEEQMTRLRNKLSGSK